MPQLLAQYAHQYRLSELKPTRRAAGTPLNSAGKGKAEM